MDQHTVVFHVPFNDSHGIFVFKGKYPVSFVDQVDFCPAKTAEDRSILTSNNPRSHDHHALREIGHLLNPLAGHDNFFVDGQFRQIARPAAGSQNNIVSPHGLFVGTVNNFNFVLTDQVRCAFLKFEESVGSTLKKLQLLIQKTFALLDGFLNFSINFRITQRWRLNVISRKALAKSGRFARKFPPGFG